MTQRLFSGPYSIDIPQWKVHHGHYWCNFHCILAGSLLLVLSALMVKSVSSKNDCLDNCDTLLPYILSKYNDIPLTTWCMQGTGFSLYHY